MNQNQIVFILDAGNTSLKLGVFKNGNLEKVHRFEYLNLINLDEIYLSLGKPTVFLASVLSINDTNKLISRFEQVQVFNQNSLLPIQIKYKSETLGLDRICNAVAGYTLSKRNKNVVIDIGTCIKFDFTDENGNYFGGSISPGIHLRYKALNAYTGNLPLLNARIKNNLIGTNTNESIISGVLNGIQSELKDFIFRYEQELSKLTFFVTGGDAEYFDFPLKNNIFADENLTLKGLYIIYELNAK
ncbi:MAG: type III pantothenate kinase [Flavobacteriia bacterium]|nr:type III pantothenate kinase [Flavobacteriia bacterium]